MSRRRHSTTGALIAICALLALEACAVRGNDSDGAPLAQGSPCASPAEGANVQPAKRWRLAPVEELSRVGVWVSHILIRHQGSTSEDVPFMPNWRIMGEPPARSRDEAAKLAQDLSAQARVHPDRFAELARATSEDVATREQGGLVGGLSAITFRPWPDVLDALASLRPGEVSEPVETNFGFHVFRRFAPPVEEFVAGTRIVIGYDRAAWLDIAKRRSTRVSRDRVAARLEALRIADEAKRNPSDMPRLVEQHSEHWDADERGGDIGVWSTREPSIMAREVATLQTMAIGTVSDPVDTFMGFTILRRDPVTPRNEYLVEMRRFPFEPDVPPSSEQSKQAALKRAEHALLQLGTSSTAAKASSADARAYRGEVASLPLFKIERWSDGRGPAALTPVVKGLGFGQVTPQPIESPRSYVILKRLDPGTHLPARSALIELPAPRSIDVAFWLPTLNEQTLVTLFERLKAAGEPMLGRSTEFVAYDQIHARLLAELSSVESRDERQRAVEQALMDIREHLGVTLNEQYTFRLRRLLEERLLGEWR